MRPYEFEHGVAADVAGDQGGEAGGRGEHVTEPAGSLVNTWIRQHSQSTIRHEDFRTSSSFLFLRHAQTTPPLRILKLAELESSGRIVYA